ncbi:GntR family transcriptional regulator [Agromyces sp. ISL-38]|uniref:GntR family transcriptional regulator n=1 Tax=Agromyces sp. ISL-38 TaxID=2819107 RepID=UPI001BEC6BC7|nr:GntR family transcriptional regulator [Agromyces sp. ISL-38]MBT2499444.1 GntR family transcriptional regulator [Agromyces sp. ISL-38]MBT2518025.1 GntR family transcriptional regulator [Streptomyces sp. ISL-90]
MSTSYLEQPLLTSPGQPLRVAVYSRIAHGIRTGVFPLGTALPRETELGVALRVSRTVVREALMLLEEDGLISTRRGVGRFVAEAVPHAGLEEFRPFDLVLAEPGAAITFRHVELTRQAATDFVTTYLQVPEDARFWFREAIAFRDGEPIAVVQEYLPADDDRAGFGGAVADVLSDVAEADSTVLMRIVDRTGLAFISGICRISVSVAGATRARQLDLKAADPVMLLTQTADLDGRPAYLAKVAVAPSVGHLSVRQSSGG